MPSQLDDEDPKLLSRIVQMRSFVATRDAMKSEKERERDAEPHGAMANIVAEVQHMNQTRGGESSKPER